LQEIDLVVRIGAASILVLVATLLLRARSVAAVPWLFAGLALDLCGFLARNTSYPDLTPTGAPALVASLLSGWAAAFLWWFCLALFDDRFRLDAWGWFVGAAWIVLATADRGASMFAAVPDLGLSPALVAMAAGMAAHLAWRLLRDREGDLVEQRRRARWWLVAILAALLLVDVGVDVFMGFAWKPAWFALLQNAAILAFAALMAHWLLRVDVDALQFRAPCPHAGAAATTLPTPAAMPVPASVEAHPPSGDDAVPAAGTEDPLLRRLHALVELERVHRDPDLTFAGFARRMGAPEPAVRRLVNQTLGYRHFRTFLNTLRVADARAALADPARSRQKLAAIAFDSGFSSLASFNRAFRDIEGRAPSEFRAGAHAE
jgi:AraC-like DNA-binding protein